MAIIFFISHNFSSRSSFFSHSLAMANKTIIQMAKASTSKSQNDDMYENLPHFARSTKQERRRKQQENGNKWRWKLKRMLALALKSSDLEEVLFLTLKVLWPRNKLIAFRLAFPLPTLLTLLRLRNFLNVYGLPNIISTVAGRRRKMLFRGVAGLEKGRQRIMQFIVFSWMGNCFKDFCRLLKIAENSFQIQILIKFPASKFTQLQFQHYIAQHVNKNFKSENFLWQQKTSTSKTVHCFAIIITIFIFFCSFASSRLHGTNDTQTHSLPKFPDYGED